MGVPGAISTPQTPQIDDFLVILPPSPSPSDPLEARPRRPWALLGLDEANLDVLVPGDTVAANQAPAGQGQEHPLSVR